MTDNALAAWVAAQGRRVTAGEMAKVADTIATTAAFRRKLGRIIKAGRVRRINVWSKRGITYEYEAC